MLLFIYVNSTTECVKKAEGGSGGGGEDGNKCMQRIGGGGGGATACHQTFEFRLWWWNKHVIMHYRLGWGLVT